MSYETFSSMGSGAESFQPLTENRVHTTPPAPPQPTQPGPPRAAAAAPGGMLPPNPPPNPAAEKQALESDVGDVRMSNQALLQAISKGDWKTYLMLCEPSLTCFEPEGCGHLIKGLGFHKYYFDRNKGGASDVNTTVTDESVRLMGDIALLTYVRITQSDGRTTRHEETRVWRRNDAAASLTTAIGKWTLVHFHRSAPQTTY